MGEPLERVRADAKPIEVRLIRIGDEDVAAGADRQIAGRVLRAGRKIPTPFDLAAPDSNAEKRRNGRVRGDEAIHLGNTGGRRPHDAPSRVYAHTHDGADVVPTGQ